MATNLYELLEVTKDSTVDEIRRAYKKKALKTHPDRLPQGFTIEQKQQAEEQFREINHAYEILISPEKRREYNTHGVWPPPEPARGDFEHFSTRGFHDPFVHRHRHTDFQSYAFRDPFELFNSIFGELHDDRGFGFGSSNFHSSPFMPFPFGQGGMSGFGGPVFSFGGPSFSQNVMSSSFGGGMSGNFGNFSPSESFSTSTINGVTTSVHTRRDADGTEHVTKTYPDGRKIYTVNGVEQHVQGQIQDNAQQTHYISQGSETRNPISSRRSSEHRTTVPTVFPRQERVPSQSSSSRRSTRSQHAHGHQGSSVYNDPYETARQHHESPTVSKYGRDVPVPQPPNIDDMNIYRNDSDRSNVPFDRYPERGEKSSRERVPEPPEYEYDPQEDQAQARRRPWWPKGFSSKKH